MDGRWVAVLSNGEEAVEHTGQWAIVPGERKPWVRLCEYATTNDLKLKELKVEVGGRWINLPSAEHKFPLSGSAPLSPSRYSLSMTIQAELDTIATGAHLLYLNVTAHYEDFEVHVVSQVGAASESWVIVTEVGEEPLAPIPA